MMPQSTNPDLEKIYNRASKIQTLCQKADANILILDEIIASLEQDIRSGEPYNYRLKKAKNLLNL